jgi:hypothetical protein
VKEENGEMTRTHKRKITVNDRGFEWCIRGNDPEMSKGRHITIYLPESQGSALYIDPYAMELEIRPKTVRQAIEFAIKEGWSPEETWSFLFRRRMMIRNVG